MTITKTPLAGLTQAELQELCEQAGGKRYCGRQLARWVYAKQACTFSEMTDLPAALRENLSNRFDVRSSVLSELRKSSDATVKSLIKLQDAEMIETVVIPAGRRLTACISTQVGCAVKCVFCASGKNGLVRNLTAGEIVEEVLTANEVATKSFGLTRISNIVLMGIGEPLMNYDNVVKAIGIINAPWGIAIGARRITLSTVGLPEGIDKLARENLQINLAVSLHSAVDETRSRIVPINRHTGVANVLDAASRYFARTGREITFEVVLIEGVNTSDDEAVTMAAKLKKIRCNVNVIPLNPTPFNKLTSPSPELTKHFCDILTRYGLNVNLRRRRGDDIDAACGQLRLKRSGPPSDSDR